MQGSDWIDIITEVVHRIGADSPTDVIIKDVQQQVQQKFNETPAVKTIAFYLGRIAPVKDGRRVLVGPTGVAIAPTPTPQAPPPVEQGSVPATPRDVWPPKHGIPYGGTKAIFEGSYWRYSELNDSAGPKAESVIYEVYFPDGQRFEFNSPTKWARKNYFPRRIFEVAGTEKGSEEGTDLWMLRKFHERRKEGSSVMFLGHQGTGKTSSMGALLGDPSYVGVEHAEVGKPHDEPWNLPKVYRAVMSNMTYTKLIGGFVPNAYHGKTTALPNAPTGTFTWMDGVLTKAIRYGIVFIADELNAADPNLIIAINSLLDMGRAITLPENNGQIVPADPDFWFVAAANPTGFGYAGTKPMNIALRSRFAYTFWYSWNEEAEKDWWPEKNKDGKPVVLHGKDTVADVHAVFDELRKRFTDGLVSYPVSFRDLKHFRENYDLFGGGEQGLWTASQALLYLFDSKEDRDNVRGLLTDRFDFSARELPQD